MAIKKERSTKDVAKNSNGKSQELQRHGRIG